MDLVVCYEYTLKTYLNDRNGHFETMASNSHTFNGSITQVALGDANHDGYPDILLYYGAWQARIYENEGANDPGDFDFTSYDWMGEVDVDYVLAFTVEELIFVDLRGTGAYSVAMTGNDNYSSEQYYLCVFFDNSNPRPQPINYPKLNAVPGGPPTIQWAASEELDVDYYVIYRALMEDNTTPTREDFDSLTTVSHPTTAYTDSSVLVHTEYDNYHIWYAITAWDIVEQESDMIEYLNFWGYYEEGRDFHFVESANSQQPGEFTLSAAPNPFNPSTAINYQLAANSYVSLKVYDTAGKLVQALADGWREAGTHEATFNASGLPSGIYFCRLQAGEFRAAQKIVLMK